MKKLMDKIACAAAICCLAACQMMEEPYFPDRSVLTATTEGDSPDTRTTLVPAGTGISQVLWSENDQIDVFMDGSTNPVLFSLAEGAGTKKGTFHGEGMGNRYVAFYPHSMVPSVGSNETVRFTLPATQEYAEGTFASGSFPMAAASNSSDLQFRNLCSVLRISLTGHNKVTRIVFRPKDASAEVCGKASVSLADPSNPTLSLSSNSCNSLVLSVPGVKLSETEDTHFFLVLPPQTYKGGFTLRVYTNERYMDKVYGSDFTMVRSKLHKADSFVYQPNGFDDSEYLEGSGTEEDPFLIGTLGDLILMRDAVNSESGKIMSASGSEVSAAEASYRLTSDIDLSLACNKKQRKNWTPIGDRKTKEIYFAGVFDGDGHVIDNLYINNNGFNYQGLFGGVSGTIRNLTVRGEVTGCYYCGIITGRLSGKNPYIGNCTTKGTVSGNSYFGGIVGYGDNATIEYCRNETTVGGSNSYYVGGIVGYAYFVGSLNHCINTGAISGAYYCGGLVGFGNGTKVFNGNNTGAVTGTSYVGGIGGYLHQGGKIYNSISSGNVKGTGYVGGICGLVSAKAISYQGPGTVANSINLGKVDGSGGTYIGCLAGYAGLPEEETPLGDEPVSGGWVKNSYWLSGVNSGIPAVGGGPGIVENTFELTDAQMKGAKYGGVLYQASGVQFNMLIDALNAGAVAWSKNTPVLGGESRDHFPLSGWEYTAKDAYPSLTDLDAMMPGSNDVIFTLSDKHFAFNAMSREFQVEVTSSLDYSLGALPAWIKETKVVSYENRPHTKVHCLTVEVNPDVQSRTATITFTNNAGTALRVRVDQEGVYLETQVQELTLDCSDNAKRLSISSSTSWTVSSDAEWCTVSPQSGSGDGIISVRTTKNEGDRARTATVTIRTDDGLFVKTVAIVQSGHTSGESGDWKTEPFVHKSLVMRYTATWCGWCPRMNKSIQRAMELYPNKISYVALHGGGSDLQFDQVDPLMSQYSISGFPSGIVDGRVYVSNQAIETAAANIVSIVKETEEKYGTVTGVEINSSVSGRTAQVDVGVYVKKAGDYKITVLLLEDGIINVQTDYEEGDHARYVHDNVARVAMSNVRGESFSVADDYSVENFSFTANVPYSCNLANMRVLVYVQRAFGAYPVIQSGSYGDYFVDNSADVALGERLALPGSGGGGGSTGGDNEGINPGDDINM